jgi:hypothetical protein
VVVFVVVLIAGLSTVKRRSCLIVGIFLLLGHPGGAGGARLHPGVARLMSSLLLLLLL